MTVQNALVKLLAENKDLLNDGNMLAEELKKYVAPKYTEELTEICMALTETKIGEILRAADELGAEEKKQAESQVMERLKKSNLQQDGIEDIVRTLTKAMGWYPETTAEIDKKNEEIQAEIDENQEKINDVKNEEGNTEAKKNREDAVKENLIDEKNNVASDATNNGNENKNVFPDEKLNPDEEKDDDPDPNKLKNTLDQFVKRLGKIGHKKIIAVVAAVMLFFLSMYNYSAYRDREEAVAHNKNGLVYQNEQQYDKAIEEYDQAIKLYPKFAEAYYNRGNIYYEKKEYKQATESYSQAIRLDPNIGTSSFKYKYAEAYSHLAYTYIKQKDHNRAIDSYTKAIEIQPDNKGGELAICHYNRGVEYAAIEEYNRAIEDYTQVITLEKKGGFVIMAYLKRGDAYAAKGDYDSAIIDYKLALTIDPNFTLAKQALNNVYNCKKNVTKK